MPPFREGPLCAVRGYIPKEGKVTVEAVEDDLLTMFRLVKAGYGTWEEVNRMNAREVLQALFYEKYLSDYEGAYYDRSQQ